MNAETKPKAGVAAELVIRLETAEARALRAAETTHGAREALNGCFAGSELDNRIKAWADCCQAEHVAVTELKAARAALMAIEEG